MFSFAGFEHSSVDNKLSDINFEKNTYVEVFYLLFNYTSYDYLNVMILYEYLTRTQAQIMVVVGGGAKCGAT